MSGIAACIGFKDRDIELLQAGIKSLGDSIDEVIVSNLSDEMLNLDCINREIYLPGLPWREALSKNIAALHSAGNILLFTNCGIVFSEMLIEAAIQLLEQGKTFVCPATMYIRANKQASERYMNGEAVDLLANYEWSHKEAGIGDFLLIYKSDFVRIGGYDSRFTGWGALDRDFNNRAEECGMIRHVAEGTLYHLYDGFPPGQHETDGGGWKANQELMKISKQTGWWRNELRKIS